MTKSPVFEKYVCCDDSMCIVRDIWTEMQTKNNLQSGTNDPRVLCLRIWRSQSQKEQVGYYDSSFVDINLLSRHDKNKKRHRHPASGTGWHHKRTRQNKTHRTTSFLQNASESFGLLQDALDMCVCETYGTSMQTESANRSKWLNTVFWGIWKSK